MPQADSPRQYLKTGGVNMTEIKNSKTNTEVTPQNLTIDSILKICEMFETRERSYMNWLIGLFGVFGFSFANLLENYFSPNHGQDLFRLVLCLAIL